MFIESRFMNKSKIVSGLLIAVFIAASSGCSWLGFADQKKEYQKSGSIEQLEVPPGLSSQEWENSVKIPGENPPNIECPPVSEQST